MLQGEHSAILLIFIKLLYVIKIFVLYIFEWPFYTGFTVNVLCAKVVCCIKLLTTQTYFSIQANSMNPDQTAPGGAV